MTGRDVVARGCDVLFGIIEKNVCAERVQEWPLRTPTKEQRLIKSNAPLAQGQDDALVRGSRSRRDERGSDRRVLACRKCLLQPMQGIQEATERPARQRLAGMQPLVLCECSEPTLARHPL